MLILLTLILAGGESVTITQPTLEQCELNILIAEEREVKAFCTIETLN